MIRRLWCLWTQNRQPYRNMAVEEYLTRRVQPGECILYLWQNDRTVVIGRNQDAGRECRTAALQADGGCLARRLSGGGAVYHDRNNLNYTFMVRQEDYDVARQLSVILRAVNSFGLNAAAGGRNDLLLQGKKFSGSAFYRSGACCYHHGTLLLQVDTAAMERYLQVSPAKLASKGIASVRARVIGLAGLIPDLTPQLMGSRLRLAFGEVYGCPVEDLPETALPEDAVAAMQQRFADKNWIYGPQRQDGCKVERRFSWGEIGLQFVCQQDRIEQVRVFSDAMEQEYAPALERMLTGMAWNLPSLLAAVDRVEAGAENLPQLKADTKELLQSLF